MRERSYSVDRMFREDSRLHVYLARKLPETFSLHIKTSSIDNAIIAMHHIFQNEQLYDPNNISCILSDLELQRATGMTSFHTSQLPGIIRRQMVLMPHRLYEVPNSSTCHSIEEDCSPLAVPYFLKNQLFRVSPKLLKVFRTLPDVNKYQVTFQFKAIQYMLSQYILYNEHRLIDMNNTKMANVEEDILGQAFSVKVFHRNQVNFLLLKHTSPENLPVSLSDEF